MRNRPRPGEQWRHYKHNPKDKKTRNNYNYTIIGIAYFNARNKDKEELCVVYRPLYESEHLQEHDDVDMYVRPFEVFMGKVKKDGDEFWRFERIS